MGDFLGGVQHICTELPNRNVRNSSGHICVVTQEPNRLAQRVVEKTLREKQSNLEETSLLVLSGLVRVVTAVLREMRWRMLFIQRRWLRIQSGRVPY